MNNPATEVTAPRCPKCGSMESSVEETRKDGEQMSTETPESLPCGCKIDVTKHGSEQSVYWNPYNKVVQCHQYGTVYDARVPVAAGAGEARRAAEEISSTFDLKLQEASLNQVAAIVTKHLGARG
jgi:hypothetical protein